MPRSSAVRRCRWSVRRRPRGRSATSPGRRRSRRRSGRPRRTTRCASRSVGAARNGSAAGPRLAMASSSSAENSAASRGAGSRRRGRRGGSPPRAAASRRWWRRRRSGRPASARSTVDQASSGTAAGGVDEPGRAAHQPRPELAGPGPGELVDVGVAGLVRGVHRHLALLVVHEARPGRRPGPRSSGRGGRPRGSASSPGSREGPAQSSSARPSTVRTRRWVASWSSSSSRAMSWAHFPILTEGVNDSPPCRWPHIGCTTWIS